MGGVETGVNEYPSMAALIDLQQRNLYCGATIIAVKYGLTASHCVENRQPSNFGLLVGDHNVNSGTITSTFLLLVFHLVLLCF